MKIKLMPLVVVATALLVSGCGCERIADSSSKIPSSSIDISTSSIPTSSDSSSVSVISSDTSSKDSSNKSSSSKSSDSSVSTSTSYDDEMYLVRVSTSAGVTYELSKTRAKQGEKVTIKLTFAQGYKLATIESTQVKLTKDSNTQYSFTMPNKPVVIKISTDVEGEITLSGGVAAALNYDSDKKMYIARNVAITSETNDVEFDLVVSGNKADALQLDESRSFADISSAYPSTRTFSIKSGCTYDFFYEPGSEAPFYVQRVSVDAFPSSDSSKAALIRSLFDGRMRSSPACHPAGLVGIDYTYDNPSLKYDYHYDLYQNNVSYAYVNDTTDPESVQKYHVYKKVDLTKNIYEVVNTYTKAKGNNEHYDQVWELDPNRTEENYYQPFSARIEIVGTDKEEENRYQISKREALRNVNSAAHYGADLEYEFWDCYRDLYDGQVVINSPENWDCKVVIDKKASGDFTATIDSYLEYDHDSTGSTADATMHQGQTAHLVMNFLKNGAIKSLTVTKAEFDKNQWNFNKHEPAAGQTGTVTTITCENTYGNVKTGAPDFDSSIYFISSISELAWGNTMTGKTSTNTESYVNYNDLLQVVPYANGGKKSSTITKFTYEPVTALDAWQYQITESDNTKAVGKNPQLVYFACGTGSANVTVTNRVPNSGGTSYKTKVTVSANGKHHGFFVNCYVLGYDSFGGDNSSWIYGTAGKTMKYYIETSSYNTGAPCEYDVVFRSENKVRGNYEWYQTSEYMKVLSTGNVLTLDFNTPASLALTEMKTLVIGLDCDYYADDIWYTEFTVYLSPYRDTKTVLNTKWKYDSYVDSSTQEKLNDWTTVELTDQWYDEDNKLYKGVITDYNEISASETYLNKWYFWWTYNEGTNAFTVKIYACDVENPDFTNIYYDYYLDIGGITKTNQLAVALYWEHDEASSSEYADILGYTYVDEEGYLYVESYIGFDLVVDK